MQWTSVKFKLPQPTKQVSWYIVNTDKGVGFAEFNFTGFGNIVIIDNSQYFNLEITHWMPLPRHRQAIKIPCFLPSHY
jgi:hypothetical protein